MTTVSAVVPLSMQSPLPRRVFGRLIDDAIVLSLAYGIAKAAAVIWSVRVPDPMEVFSGEVGLEPAATLATAGMLVVVALAYYGASSFRGGHSFGRAVTRVKVVCADGTQATRQVLLGRELIRVVMVAGALALAWPTTIVLRGVVDDLVDNDDLRELLWWTAAWLPYPAVAAAWISAALVDPLGRAPHDRAAGTFVVMQSRERSA